MGFKISIISTFSVQKKKDFYYQYVANLISLFISLRETQKRIKPNTNNNY